MRKIIFLFITLSFMGCKTESPTQFSTEALNDTFVSLDGKLHSFKDIINQYKGRKVLIDVWASWCKDCIKGLPNLKALQKEKPNIVYVFLSLDNSVSEWKQGIDLYKIKGQHYLMQSGWEGDFGSFLKLTWIPRYLVVDEQGAISLFKATVANDKFLKEALKK